MLLCLLLFHICWFDLWVIWAQGLCLFCTLPWSLAQWQAHRKHLPCWWINQWMNKQTKHIWRSSWNSVLKEGESPKLGQGKASPVSPPKSGFGETSDTLSMAGEQCACSPALESREQRGRRRAQTRCRWGGCWGPWGGTLALASLIIFLFIFLFVPNYLRQCPTLAKKRENS